MKSEKTWLEIEVGPHFLTGPAAKPKPERTNKERIEMAGKRGQRTRAKRARAETSEEDFEALVRGLEGEHEKAKAEEARLAQGLKEARSALCSQRQEANDERLGRLPPEIWGKVFEKLHENDLLSVALSCRFLRQQQKNDGRSLITSFYRRSSFSFRPSTSPEVSEAYLRHCYELALREEEGAIRACWGDYFPIYAAGAGHLDYLKELKGQGKKIDEWTMERAAYGGHIE